MPLLRNSGDVSLLTVLNFLHHPVLIELVVKHVLVRTLELLLVDALLFDLLCGLGASGLLALHILLLDPVLCLLLLHGKISHMLLVDVRLLVKSRALMCHKSLLVSIPGIVVELGARRQVLARLA